MIFLTDAEVAELTGYKLPSKQAKQLQRQKIQFFLSATGRPKVVRSALEGRKQEEIPATWSPAWAGNR